MSKSKNSVMVVMCPDDVLNPRTALHKASFTDVSKRKRMTVIAVAVLDQVWPFMLLAWAYFNKVEIIMRNAKDPVQHVVEFTSALIYIMLADKSVLAVVITIASLGSDNKTWMYSCRIYVYFYYIFVWVISFLGVVAVILAYPEFGFNEFQRLAGNMMVVMIRLPDTILVHSLANSV